MSALSPRLAAIVDALPLRPGRRVLEIGGAPGAAAKAVAEWIGNGHILVIDRSAKGVAQIRRNAAADIEVGLLSTRRVAAEDFELLPSEAPFDLAFAVRVGAFDGRPPEAGTIAKRRIAAALTPTGRLFIDGGNPLREISLARPDDSSSTAGIRCGRYPSNDRPAADLHFSVSTHTDTAVAPEAGPISVSAETSGMPLGATMPDAPDASAGPSEPLPLTGERTVPGIRRENYWISTA